jgi:hypothetical protein
MEFGNEKIAAFAAATLFLKMLQQSAEGATSG